MYHCKISASAPDENMLIFSTVQQFRWCDKKQISVFMYAFKAFTVFDGKIC